jgi:hypothetical protein
MIDLPENYINGWGLLKINKGWNFTIIKNYLELLLGL